MARSERFELPTPRFEVWCSIQLSYERRRESEDYIAPSANAIATKLCRWHRHFIALAGLALSSRQAPTPPAIRRPEFAFA